MLAGWQLSCISCWNMFFTYNYLEPFLDLSFCQEPRNSCRSVPDRKCTQVTVITMKACSYLFLQVLKEVCKDVPKEHCEYLPKLVAKKKCEKQKKFVDKLKDMVKW